MRLLNAIINVMWVQYVTAAIAKKRICVYCEAMLLSKHVNTA